MLLEDLLKEKLCFKKKPLDEKLDRWAYLNELNENDSGK